MTPTRQHQTTFIPSIQPRNVFLPNILLKLALLCIILIASIPKQAAAANGNNVPSSPIRHLESSLTASSAQSTAVAILADCDDDEENEGECVVILSCSPSSGDGAGWNLTADAAMTMTISSSASMDEDEERRLCFLPRGLVQIPLHPRNIEEVKDECQNLHVLHEQSGICCAVTGFASDARHIVNVAARYVSDYEHLYGSSTVAGNGPGPTVHKVVRDLLAKKLAGAAFAANGRPYGVQFLVVGNRPMNANTGMKTGRTSSSLQMYTIDPSGGWRHWGGGGTAVGRNAALVRKKLHSALMMGTTNQDQQDEKKEAIVSYNRPKGWSNALDIVMRAYIESTHDDKEDILSRWEKKNSQDDDDNTNNMRGQYDAIVVFGYNNNKQSDTPKKRRRSLCAAIDRETVAESYWRCIQQIVDEKQETTI